MRLIIQKPRTVCVKYPNGMEVSITDNGRTSFECSFPFLRYFIA